MTRQKTLKNNNKAVTLGLAAVAGSIAMMGDPALAKGSTDGFQKLPAEKFTVTYNADGSATLQSATQTLHLTADEFKVIDGVLYVQDQIAAEIVSAGGVGAGATTAAVVGLAGLALAAAGGGGSSTTPGVNSAPTVAHPIADTSVGAGTAVHIVVPANTFVDADHDTLTYTATFADGAALSTRGLSFDAATRTVSGTLTGAGPATIKVTANDGRGGMISDAFVLSQVANSAPTVAHAIADQSVAAGTALHFVVPANTFADADHDTLTYTATFADGAALSTRGLSFDAATGTISGTLTGAGPATINVTANDGRGGTVMDAFVLSQVANSAPTVANPIADQSVVTGAAVHFIVPANTFVDADHDALTYSATFSDGSALSTRGLSFDPVTHAVDGTLTGAGPATISITANDGRGGVVSDAFVLSQTAAPPAVPIVTDPGAQSLVENAAAGTTIFTATANAAITSWTLSGPDAALFAISAAGVVTAIGPLDHEAATDTNHDGIYTFTVNATGATGTGSHAVNVTVTDVTELPSWLANATEYGIGYTKPSSVTASNEVVSNGVHTLLDSDADNGLGSESHWNGAGHFNQPAALTFGFVGAGGILEPSDGHPVTLAETYSAVEQSFIRSVFEHFSNVSGLTFTEQTGAAASTADLRLGIGTYQLLGVAADTLGFAFQPSGADPRATPIFGDFFLVSNANGLVGTEHPFATPYGDERNTISHELGHAVGLDHPFADRTANSGFAPITSTTDLHPDYTNDQTGGGYQSQQTDNVMESIMAYYNPYSQTADMGSHSLTNTPWQLSIYDIAALQHLYGANMTFATGDNVYSFNSDTQVFTTIWDAGGTDSIVQVGDRSAYIDMHEGSYSCVGFLGGRTYTFTPADLGLAGTSFDSVTLVEMRDGIVTLAADHHSFTYTTDMSVGGLNSDLSFNVVVGGVAHNNVGNFSGLSVDHANNAFNLGIAFGVTIENATGGNGADTIIGNDAANIITGGGGNDLLTGNGGGDIFAFAAGFGADKITDFVFGQDMLRFDGFTALAGSSIVAGNTVLDLGLGNTVTLLGTTHALTAGTDYVFA